MLSVPPRSFASATRRSARQIQGEGPGSRPGGSASVTWGIETVRTENQEVARTFRSERPEGDLHVARLAHRLKKHRCARAIRSLLPWSSVRSDTIAWARFLRSSVIRAQLAAPEEVGA